MTVPPDKATHATTSPHSPARLATPPAPWRRRMVPRDHDAEHRSSTNLELLFDLTFVVAVAQAAHSFAEHLIEGHVGGGIGGYLSVFFAIWWAWVNFTWFASAFDTDDVFYRLLTLVQMTGVLVLAAGVPRAFDGGFTTVTVGYVIMRVAMLIQWVRAGLGDPASRATCFRYAGGIAVVQLGWILRLALPQSLGWLGFVVLALAEMAVPYWAEQPGMTSWHPSHIAERYGGFTIIVLGEGISQVGLAFQSSFSASGVTLRLGITAGEGLILLFALWWIYFARDPGDALRERPHLAYFWGYGHYLLFAAVAAVAASLDVGITALHPASGPASGHVALSRVSIALAVAVPVAIYLLALGVMMGRLHGDLTAKARRSLAGAVSTVLLAGTAKWFPLTVVGALLVLPTLALIVEEIIVGDRRARTAPAAATE